ncbi:hypothetical protein HDF14_005302 [Edaphobacter lichenicola]|uniref:Uncharacterized protein n=1 Tax=Tunturiibacter gelidiferens TaxID=3069689 RepID=A0A9X0QJP7_9BACT|nr:hypothetical protein [Edaphobacter lichenicola]
MQQIRQNAQSATLAAVVASECTVTCFASTPVPPSAQSTAGCPSSSSASPGAFALGVLGRRRRVDNGRIHRAGRDLDPIGLQMEVDGSVALNPLAAVWLLLYRSGCDREDFEELVDERDIFLNTWLTGKTMPSPDHRITLNPLIVAEAVFLVWNPQVGRITRLRAPRSVLIDVVQVFFPAMLCRV